MKKNFTKIILLIFMLLIGISSVSAASFNVSVGSRSLTKGGSTRLTISGSDVTGRFNISSSNPSVVSISEDRAWIENNSYTITLTALNVGTSTITISPSGVSNGSGSPVSLGAKSIQVTVSLPREKATDNNLRSLSVEGFEISPAFSKSVLDYSLTVPEGTKKIKINASVNESHASVSGAGVVEVTEGINNFSIVVKAENGSKKTYNLSVNVIDENPINVDINGNKYTLVKLRDNLSCPELFKENEITIEEALIPTCFNEKLNYTLVGLKSEDGKVENYIYNDNKYEKYIEVIGNSLKVIILDYNGDLDGFNKVKEKINDVEYNVFKSDKSTKTFVVYGANIETGKKDFYVYDTVNKTFSIFETEQVEDLNNLSNLNNTYIYVIIAFGIALLLSIICIISLSASKKKIIKKFKEQNKDNKSDIINKKKKIEVKEKNDNDIEEIISEEEKTETYNIMKDDNNKRKKKSKKKEIKEND